MGDVDLETHQRRPSVKYERVDFKTSSHEGRLKVLKRNLVAQMLGKPGIFREAVEKVRVQWQIEGPPSRLPPKSEGILYPPSLAESNPYEELHALYLKAVGLTPPQDPSTLYINLTGFWHNNVRDALLGSVPGKYLEDSPPHALVDGSPVSKQALAWYRFAAACVLYDPPLEQAQAFADYGGLPPLPGEENSGEPISGVLTERQLREQEIGFAEQSALG